MKEKKTALPLMQIRGKNNVTNTDNQHDKSFCFLIIHYRIQLAKIVQGLYFEQYFENIYEIDTRFEKFSIRKFIFIHQIISFCIHSKLFTFIVSNHVNQFTHTAISFIEGIDICVNTFIVKRNLINVKKPLHYCT